MPDVTLDLGNQYIGSAYSPQVAITDTEDGHEVTFTFADSENPGQLTTASYDVPTYADEEAAREAAEAQRQAYEAQRVAQEQARAAAESARQAQEASRQSAETERANAEAERRQYETDRRVTEYARQQAEDARASAEQARASAETARASAEAGRATAESARVSAEQARATAEGARAAAESARVTAEQARQTDTAAAIARADAATAAANTATTNADAATTAAQAATGEAETATDAANAAAALATAAAETVTDAYFPMFTAGAAEGITGGGPTDTAAWTYRACPGTDGPATIESIHGRTLVWNQMRKPTDGYAGTYDGITITLNQNGSVTLSGTSTVARNFTLKALAAGEIVIGHKYLIRGTSPSGGSAQTYYGGIGGAYIDLGNGGIWTNTSVDVATSLRFDVRAAGITIPETTLWPQLFDLTAMFGAGNEPSTVAEFEALFPDAYYPYDAGSLLSVNMTGIESADADGNVLMERTIPATDLRSAGTVYDEQTATERITRVGEVDMGTLAWTVDSGGRFMVRDDSILLWSTLMCVKYDSYAGQLADMPDKSISATNSQSFLLLRVRDDTYTDAATFKAAMNGVMLHYALATPTTTPIDPPLNLTYKAAAGGTERVMHTDPTAPPTLAVTYGSTADGIRDRALSAIAPVENGKASANYGVGSYLIHGGQLCRVTTAIAAGEAIAIGTNVTATTVMAELLTLTQ